MLYEVITLCQRGVYSLFQELLARNLSVLLETNGSLPICEVPDGVHIIMDVKCPDSGMADHNLAENLEVLRDRQRRGCHDEIVITSYSIHYTKLYDIELSGVP